MERSSLSLEEGVKRIRMILSSYAWPSPISEAEYFAKMACDLGRTILEMRRGSNWNEALLREAAAELGLHPLDLKKYCAWWQGVQQYLQLLPSLKPRASP